MEPCEVVKPALPLLGQQLLRQATRNDQTESEDRNEESVLVEQKLGRMRLELVEF